MDSDNEGISSNYELSMNSTVRGITIERNDEKPNAYDSIRFNDDGLSNVIESRDPQCAKQCEQRTSTCDPITT
jgi:hypothetical protein